MISVGTYFWKPDHGSKFSVPYGIEDVRRLQQGVAKNTTVPHEFVVATDQPELFENEPDIRAIPIDRTTHVDGTCYVRLMTFHPGGAGIFGERFVQIDLDCLIVGNIDHILKRDEDLILWRNPTRTASKPGRSFYNTSIVSHRPGSMPFIWTTFDHTRLFAKDDQWHLSALLGESVPFFNGVDGIYRIAREDTPGSGVDGHLPENAAIVFFTGSDGKMDNPKVREKNPWIDEVLSEVG